MFKFFRKKEQGTTIKSFNDLLNYVRAFNISPYNVNVQRMLKQIPENPFISSALERMQQGFYSIDWSVYEENTEGKNEKKDNIVYRSLINPNALMDTDDFLYYCYQMEKKFQEKNSKTSVIRKCPIYILKVME